MKKLMIAAAIVCAAAMSHAAAISWAAGSITTPDGSGAFTSTAAENAKGTLYQIDKTTYEKWIADLSAATTLEAQQTQMTKLYESLQSSTPVTGQTNIGYSKGNITLKDPTDITSASGTNPIDLYAAVVYTVTEGGKDWFIADVGKYQAVANSNKTVANMALNFGGTGGAAIQGWATAAVPEPTSGLLLLLGVAGLALRRRRA